MKKLLLFGTLIVFGAAIAFTQGYGYRMGPRYGYNQGYWYGPGYCMNRIQYQNPYNGKQINMNEAKKLVTKILEENFKGYKIVNIEKYNMPMGTMYDVEVVDAAGNKFKFHVNPWGHVMGPFTKIAIK